jgi:quercetin dioxygenase-like cupin family protein
LAGYVEVAKYFMTVLIRRPQAERFFVMNIQGDKQMNRKEISAPSMLLDLNQEISGILSEKPWHETGRNSRTIAKYSNFRIVLAALHKGAELEKHQAKGCISIQVLRGRILVRLAEHAIEISKENLLSLDNAIPHAVEALEDSIFLITMSFNAQI